MTHLDRWLAWLIRRTDYEVITDLRRDAILLALGRL